VGPPGPDALFIFSLVCLLRLHAAQQPDATVLATGGEHEVHSRDKVSCSHGCVPASVKARGGEMQSQAVLEEIFKTSLAVEEYYWCVATCDRVCGINGDTTTAGIKSNKGLANQCKLVRTDEIKKRDPSCQGDSCLYTGPTPMRTKRKPKEGMCDDDSKNGKYWSCKFRTCNTDGCNFSAAPNNAPHAFAAVISCVLSLVLTFAQHVRLAESVSILL
jgi:hypothetical protein